MYIREQTVIRGVNYKDMYNDRCDLWPEDAKAIVKRFIPSDYYSLGNSNNFIYQTQYPFLSQKMVISYNPYYKAFAVWDVMNSNFVGDTKTLSLGREGESFAKKTATEELVYTIQTFYKRNERVLLVGEQALYEFCSNYIYYLFGENFFDDIESGLEVDDTKKQFYREYVSYQKKKRDPKFRDRILKKFNNTCIVCGCKEMSVLQAAHIQSVEDGGDDSEVNGYCLCANHHLLFDSHKLAIDMGTKTFECRDTSEIDSLWYKEAKKRNFKLIL